MPRRPGAEPGAGAAWRAAGPALRTALRKDPSLAGKIEKLVSEAGGLLGLPAGEALHLTGFEKGDSTPGRLDAALAELRAAQYLAREGFANIRAVGRAAGRTADLAAERGGELWLFEVRWVRGGFGQGAAEKLSDKCRRKAAQLRSGLKRLGAARGGLIFVGEPLGFGPFLRSAALEDAAAAVKCPPRSGPAGKLSISLLSGDAAGSIFLNA